MVGVTVGEARVRLEKFLAREWECTKDLPHKSKIKRHADDDMHIEFRDGYKDFIPPPKQYKTPVHLLPKLEAFLKKIARTRYNKA